jgi:predicted O-methyltransferase YrrM
MKITSNTWETFEPVFLQDLENPAFLALPWGGHRRFAYDLVRSVKPSTIVELGSHVGNSLMTFCQGILDSKAPCTIFGIDTWTGDEQAGYYGEEVWETLNQTVEKYFKSIDVRLVRSNFDNQISNFEDNSIDLIHIDGLHTYEACKHDFESWLPKLAKNGLVLLHDVSSDSGYGSANYWIEIARNYPNIAFEHSFGLGVIAPKGTRRVPIFTRSWSDRHCERYALLAQNDLLKLQVHDLTEMVNSRDAAIISLSKQEQ